MNNKKTSYKLLSLDLDGTLLSPVFHKAKKADCLAIQRYMSCGGMPLINTGRAPWRARKAIDRINSAGQNKIKIVSYMNGAYIEDLNDSEVIETKISHSYVKKILEIVKKYKGAIMWLYTKDGIKNHTIYTYPDNLFLKLFYRGAKLTKIKDGNDLSSYKISLLSLNKKVLAKVQHDLLEHNINQIANIIHSSSGLIEITPKGIDKGNAVSHFAKKYNINRTEIASIGDSFNDLSAFQKSALTIGINPKDKNFFKHCGAIINKKTNGVAQAINSYLLKDVGDNKCKLIFCDLDGTLIDGSTKLFSNETKFALQQCTNHLIPIAIASGRGIYDGTNIVEAMELNPKTNVYIIGNNGATIYDIFTKQYIVQSPIENNVCKNVFETLKQIVKQENGKMGFIVHQHSPELLFYNEEFWKPINLKKTGFADKYDPWIYCKSIYIDEYPEDIICYKFVVKFPNHESALKGNESLRKQFPNLEVCLSSDVNVEINKKGINKGVAAKILSEKIGINMSESIVLGDGQNDISVLRLTGNSFAPDYAPDFVQKEAKHVIEGVGPCNFAATVIDQYILKREDNE